MVKLGARGVRAGGTEHPAHPVDAVDSTGAGDAFAAGYLVGGVSLGLAAAARAVAQDGSDAVRIDHPLLTDEVQDALDRGLPVVALETTLVSHGFPGGEGVQVALAAEARVREAGAVPATIGIVDGVLRVGLTESDLKRFASAGRAARKVGARDLAACLVQGALGATTVGGTLAVCRLAGIRFMATGGTGGVHRGFATVPDVSADLPQIARTQALVVSSGVKSILDVAATAELLETLAVPVLGWRTAHAPDVLQRRGWSTSVRGGDRRRGGRAPHRCPLAPQRNRRACC